MNRVSFALSFGALAVVLVACGGAVTSDPTSTSENGTPGGGTSTTSPPGYSPPSGTTTSSPPSGTTTSTPPSKPPVQDAGAPGQCTYGKPTTQCYTPEQLAVMWQYPSMGGDTDADGGRPLPATDPNGCFYSKDVRNDCCNPAISGPEVAPGPGGEETCCYVFCDGACC